MNRTLASRSGLIFIAFLLLTISATAQVHNAIAAATTSALKTEKEKQSYAVGMNIATQIKAKSIDLDTDMVVRGVQDVLSGQTTLLTDQEARSVVAQLRQDMKQKAVAARREKPQQKSSQQASAESNSSPAAAPSLSDIRVSFKMDARLSGPTYGGERWIVSPTFTSPVQPGKEATVEARVDGIASNGSSTVTSAEWKPADPEMISIVPGANREVKITVHHTGETKLIVASNGISKQLLVKATSLANGSATQVEFKEAQ